jgi:hypothetical protein
MPTVDYGLIYLIGLDFPQYTSYLQFIRWTHWKPFSNQIEFFRAARKVYPMKTLLVRAFAFSLVAAGVVASAQISARPSDIIRIGTKVAAVPVAVCPPNDPNGCGIGNMGK